MTPQVPVWSLSHWYMWIPLWLIVAAPVCIGVWRAIIALRDVERRLAKYEREIRDRALLKDGAINLDDYRRRKGIKS